MILDTDFIIDVMENEAESLKKLHAMILSGKPQAIAAPTLFELYSGAVRSSKTDNEKEKILSTLKNMPVYHLDPSSAQKAGEIDGRLWSAGCPIQPIDSMIAGIALSVGETVLTRNTKHFSRVPGLKVETY